MPTGGSNSAAFGEAAMPEAGHRSWACLNRGVEVSHISSNSRYTCWAQAVWLRQARAISGR